MSVLSLERIGTLDDRTLEHTAHDRLTVESEIALSGLAELSVRRHALPEEGSDQPYGRMLDEEKPFLANIEVRGPYIHIIDPTQLTTVIYSQKPLKASEQLHDPRTGKKTWLMHYMRVVDYRMLKGVPAEQAMAAEAYEDYQQAA